MRIFISSPSDLTPERRIVLQVVGRLGAEFKHHFAVMPVLWEHEPLLATEHFQEGLVSPAECDIVLCMLWSRVGSPLPENRFRRADGSAGITGTEWEYQMAADAFARSGRPQILFYRKLAPVQVSLDDPVALERAQAQKQRVDAFFLTHFHNDDAEHTFRNAYWTFESIDDLENQVYTHLSALLREHVPSAGDDDAAVVWHQGSPFRGLAAFDLEHADIFFGRNRARSEAFYQFQSQVAAHTPFMMLLGTSGSGKSSLVRAGLLPMLLTPGVVEGVAECRWCVFKPSDSPADPIGGLTRALAGAACLPELAGEDEDGVVARATSAPHALETLVFSTLGAIKQRTGYRADLFVRVVIVVDQFEELFTLPAFSDATRTAFVSLLASLVRSEHTWVIGTMRSDFYVHCEGVPELVELMRGNGQLHLTPPAAEEIAQMIELPARAAGLRFERDADGIALDEVLRHAAAGEPAVLPLLSFTLDRLFEAREGQLLTHAAYRDLGGIEGAISRHADAVHGALSPACRAQLPALLGALVTIRTDETETIGARRADWRVAAANPERRTLTEAFVAARLLAVSGDGDGATVSVVHEALLRSWNRARDWIAENVEDLRARTRLATTARFWDAEGRPDGLLLPDGALLDRGRAFDAGGTLLDTLETVFVRASIARIERAAEDAAAAARGAARRRRRWMVGFAGVAAGVVAASVLLLEGRDAQRALARLDEAREREAAATRVNSFARLSLAQTAGGDPLNGLHLGIEAANRSTASGLERASNARAALHAAVWAQPIGWTLDAPVHVPELGDGLLIETTPPRRFDLEAGREAPLGGAGARILATAGPTVAILDGTMLRFRDLPSGREPLRWQSGRADGPRSAASAAPPVVSLDPSGRFAAVAAGATLALLDVERGRKPDTAAPGATSAGTTRAVVPGSGSGRRGDAIAGAGAIGPGTTGAVATWPGSAHTRLDVDPQGRSVLASGGVEPITLFVHAADGDAVRVLERHVETGDRTVALEPYRVELADALFLPNGRIVTTAVDGTRALWDAANGREVGMLPPAATHARLVPLDGRRLLAGGGSHGIAVIDTHTGIIEATLLHTRGVVALTAASGPQGAAHVAALDAAGTLYLWSSAGALVLRVDAAAEDGGGRALETVGPARLLVRLGRRVLLFDTAAPAVLARSETGASLDHAATSVGDVVVVRESARTLARYATDDGRLLGRDRPGYEAEPLAGHAGAGRFATRSFGRVVEHRDARTGRELASAVAAHPVATLDYLDGGRFLLARGGGQATLWAIGARTRVRSVAAPEPIADVSVDGPSERVALAFGSTVDVLDDSGRLLVRHAFAAPVQAVAMEPGGARFAAVLRDGVAHVRAADAAGASTVRLAVSSTVRALHWPRRNGAVLAVDASHRVFRVRTDGADGARSAVARHWEPVRGVDETEHGFSSLSGASVTYWTDAGGAVLVPRVVRHHGATVEALARAPGDGGTDRVISVERERLPSTSVFDTELDREIGRIPIARSSVRQFAASPDNSIVGVVDDAHQLRIWALRDGAAVARGHEDLTTALLAVHGGRRDGICRPSRGAGFIARSDCVPVETPTRLVFSSDGQRLLVGRDGQAVFVYDAASGARTFAHAVDTKPIGFTVDSAGVLMESADGKLATLSLGGSTPDDGTRLPLKPYRSPVELRGGEGRLVVREDGERQAHLEAVWRDVAAVLDVHAGHGEALVRLHDGSIELLDIVAGTRLARLDGTTAGHAARLSADGRRAVAWRDRSARIWPIYGRDIADVATRILAGAQ